MKMKKRELNLFPLYDFTGIQRHLEKMASQGWLLEKQTPTFWYYRRTEPSKIHYSVAYFAKASEFDPEPGNEQRTYQDYCTAAGWTPVSTLAQMQVYMNTGEDPVPIETDAVIQVNTIHNAMKRNFVLSQLLILLIAIFGMGQNLYIMFDSPVSFFADYLYILPVLSWLLLGIQGIVLLAGYVKWHHDARKTAEQDGSLKKTNGHIALQYFILIYIGCSLLTVIVCHIKQRFVLIMILSLLSITMVFYLVNRIKNALKRHKVSKGLNRTITIFSSVILTVLTMIGIMAVLIILIPKGFLSRKPVETYEFVGHRMNVYQDELPLSLEDIMEVDTRLYSKELDKSSTIFLSHTDAKQRVRLDKANATPNLEYEITSIHVPFIYDLCLNHILNRYTYDDWPEEYQNKYLKVEDERWEADAVYQFHSDGTDNDWYCVCWGNRIVEIRLYWTPTDDEIRKMAEVLKNL